MGQVVQGRRRALPDLLPALAVPPHRWNRGQTLFTDRLEPRAEAGEARLLSWSQARSRPRLGALLLVLCHARLLIQERTTMTRRELFYRHTDIFRSQRAVDVAVADAAALLGTPSWRLNLMASSRGFLAGPLLLRLASGEELRCTPTNAVSVPVPDAEHTVVAAESSARFVLVVEKDAAFQRLLQEGALARVGPCILLTGRGYPDVATLSLLRRLWTLLRLPMLLLVDCDPDGIAIMCSYRFGTRSLCHETRCLALPNARWLGVLPRDLSALGVPARPLSQREKALLRSLEAHPGLAPDPVLLGEVRELQRLSKKAEIEDLAELSAAYLTDVYLPAKIEANEPL